MDNTRVFRMAFASVYPHYVAKVEKKGRTKAELHAVIEWLTGYDESALLRRIEERADFETFFARAPRMNPNAAKITGAICGYRVEQIEDPLMRRIRCLDKLVDELAKGKSMEKILRQGTMRRTLPNNIERRWLGEMSNHAAELLEAFESLAVADQQAFAVEVLRRTRDLPFDSGPITDEEIGEAGRALFVTLDQEENAPAPR